MTDAMHEFDFVRDAARTHQEKVATEKVNRSWDVQAVSSVQSTLSDRRLAAASAISRKTLYEAAAGVCNAALASLCGLLYEDISGQFVNVNPDTWKINIPLPWGRKGRKYYGLRSTEADTLRAIMLSICDDTGHGHIHWVFYDTDMRHWCVNLADYPTVDYGRAYLKKWSIPARIVAYHWRTAVVAKRGR